MAKNQAREGTLSPGASRPPRYNFNTKGMSTMEDRIFRTIFFPPPPAMPVTFVTLESEMQVSAEVAKHDLLHPSATDEKPEGLTVVDIFPCEEGTDIAEAVQAAFQGEPEDAQRLHNMSILYWYDVATLGVCVDDGMMLQTIPSPLSKDDIVFVLKQVCQNPAYVRQTLHALDEDGHDVYIREGKEVTAP